MIEHVKIDTRVKIRDPVDLLAVPKAIHVRRFTELAAKKFCRELNECVEAKQGLIPVVINSYGGDVYALLTMVDALKSSKATIATVVEGKAMSCGAVLFSCGQEGMRFAAPNATIMLHDVASSGIEGKAGDILVSAKEVNRLNRKVWSILERNIGKPRGTLWNEAAKRGRADWYLSPQDAQALGLVNVIKVPRFTTTIKVESVLDW